MSEHPAVQQAVAKALSEALGTIQRQLGEVQGSFEQVKQALSEAGAHQSADRFVALLPPLMHMQASGAALAASIETVLRFVGISAQWSGLPAMAPPRRVEEVVAEPAEELAEAQAPPPVEEPVVEELAPPEEPLAAEEPVAEAPPAEEAPPAPAPAAAPVEIESLPEELKELHKKAKRFAKVTVQDLAMYKKAEIAKGLENRDLYKRLKDEIDRSKATYDKRFEKIAEHNVDYLYEEIVRVLTKDDPGALGDYPYPTPGRQ
jgi:hypothetical protein